MAIRWAITGGSWSNITTWNDGTTLGIPTVGDDVYTNGFTVLVDTGFTVNSLNNSAKSLGSKATPNMTSNGSPSGFVISNNSSSISYLAFNGNALSENQGWQAGATTGWIGYIPATPFIATRYVLSQWWISTYGGGNVNAPTSWNFEGSNDGVSWTILHSVSGFALTDSVVYTSPLFSNTIAYSRYRVNLLTINGGTNTTVGEVQIFAGNNSITNNRKSIRCVKPIKFGCQFNKWWNNYNKCTCRKDTFNS